MSNLLSKNNFDIEIMGVWDGYEYTLQETKKADNKVNPDLLFSYIDRIDSAVVINKKNDNVHLFYFKGNFMIITDSMVCEKSKQWRPQGNEWWAYRDTMIFRNNNKNKYISWLPQYVKDALTDGEYQKLETLGTIYNFYDSRMLTDTTLKDIPLYSYYHWSINNGKINAKEKVVFAFWDEKEHLYDQIYYEEMRLTSKGQYIDTARMSEFYTSSHNNILDSLMCSVYNDSLMIPIIQSNSNIMRWSNLIMSYIDSLDIVNYEADTLYYQLYYSKYGEVNNRAFVYTSTDSLYFIETFGKIIWDKVPSDFMVDSTASLTNRILDIEYDIYYPAGYMYYNDLYRQLCICTIESHKNIRYINGKQIDTVYKSKLYSNMGRNEGIVIQLKVGFYKGKIAIIDKNYISANIYFHF